MQEYEKSLSQSASDVASFDAGDQSLLYRLRHFLHHNPAAVPLIVLVMSLLVFGITLGGKFFSAFALTLILQQVAITGIVAAAQTLVILTAGIDLSVGAIMVLSSVVMGQFTFRYGLPAELSILFGFATGALCGFINGFLIAYVRLPPFIVTLGMWQVIRRRIFFIPRMKPFVHRRLRQRRLSCSFWRKHSRRWGGLHLWRYRDGTFGFVALVRAKSHGRGAMSMP